MELVLDSSVALAWVLPDETSSRADRLLEAYLELTQRRGLGLATFDRRLIRAARRAGVKIAPASHGSS